MTPTEASAWWEEQKRIRASHTLHGYRAIARHLGICTRTLRTRLEAIQKHDARAISVHPLTSRITGSPERLDLWKASL